MVEIKNLVCVGVGQMGAGIAQVALMAGFNVILEDIKDEFVNKAWASIEDGMKKLEAKDALEGNKAADFMAKCKKSTNLASAVKSADIMIEAVVENMDIKKQVFKTCGDNAPKHCILATNTSTMSITEIGKDCGRPDKVCGMHFFNPVPLMRCIEIIKGGKTSDETTKIAENFASKLPCLKGKRYIAIVLKDRPGFIVNRVIAPVQIYQNYVFDLAEQKKISWKALDNDSVGPMPMCVLADFVGIDTLFHVQNYYVETLSPDFAPGKVITRLFKEGKLGAKTGQGFHDWTKGRPEPDKSAGKAKLFNLKYPLAIMVNEGCRVLEEGVSNSWKVIDDAVMAGMNTPGPMTPNVKNSAKLVEDLNELVKLTGKKYFAPCELLKSEAWVNKK